MRLVSAGQMRNIDNNAINKFGIPGIVLMENAALAVVNKIRKVLHMKEQPKMAGKKGVVLVGKGNNGGDGFAIARHLSVAGMEVTVFLFSKAEELTGDARLNYELYLKMGGKIVNVEDEMQIRLFRLALIQADIAIDALFGTGFKGTLPEIIEKYVAEINKSNLTVLSVDIPSGLEADTGKVASIAVKADCTVTFGLAKLGHFLGEGPIHTGELIIDQISIPESIIYEEKISTYLLTAEIIKPLIPIRNRNGHKGTHGTGVFIGGSVGMSGAAVLAGRSALRSGIGMLQMVVPEGIVEAVDCGVIEGTVWPAPDYEMLGQGSWNAISDRLQRADVCAVGPGLKENTEFLSVITNILKDTSVPVILDADALNLVARQPELLSLRKGQGSLVVTPHPGEMSRLCQCTVAEVQENRVELALVKAVEWGAIVVLKGAVTVVASPDGRVFLNPTGNSGLGTGGTGDVLTGCIMAYAAQGVPLLGAACLGAFMHGTAADELSKTYGLAGFTASEVADMIPKVRKELEFAE